MIADKSTPTEPLLWTVASVAREIQASTSYVYKAAERGEIPCRRLGAMLRFVAAEVRAWALGASTNVRPLPLPLPRKGGSGS